MENLSPLKHNANCLIFIRRGYAKGIALSGVIAILMIATRKQNNLLRALGRWRILKNMIFPILNRYILYRLRIFDCLNIGSV